jgi:hypothetical protein
LIPTLAIQNIENGKIDLEPHSGGVMATSRGLKPSEIANKLLDYELRGESPFDYSDTGKRLTGELLHSSKPTHIKANALWEHGRSVGKGFDGMKRKLPQCKTGESLDASHVDAIGDTVYYCWKSKP